jgi:hypothetical protein
LYVLGFPQQTSSELAEKVGKCLVFVQFNAPFGIEGFKHKAATGVGVIVHKGLGLVLVDRGTVPILLGSVTITLAGAVTLPAKTVFLHPYQV